MNKELKRYLVSSGVTFLAVFLGVLSTELQTLSLDSLTKGAIISIILTALRAAIKGLIEYVIPLLTSKIKK